MTVLLAIDTATEAVITGVVRVDGERVETLAERSIAENRRHAEILTTLIREVLAEAGMPGADLDGVVVGIGPGPFTGLRVGMATAAAYADALDLPLHGVCTLDAIAVDACLPGDALVVTDARRREVYWARYRDGVRIDGPDVVAPASLESAGATVVGPARFADVIGGTAHVELIAPSAAGLVSAFTDPRAKDSDPRAKDSDPRAKDSDPRAKSRGTTTALEPLYLRRPDAVELKDQRRKSLLPVREG